MYEKEVHPFIPLNFDAKENICVPQRLKMKKVKKAFLQYVCFALLLTSFVAFMSFTVPTNVHT